ncbi:alcohol dehydrogenase catalytic domain-containing protein, partial [Xanthomonas citri pv. citri]
PDPVAGPGEAVIAIKAAALNFFDILMIQGKYQIKPPFPFSPAAEVAGVIESIGPGVTDVKVGDASSPPAATTARARRSHCRRRRS